MLRYLVLRYFGLRYFHPLPQSWFEAGWDWWFELSLFEWIPDSSRQWNTKIHMVTLEEKRDLQHIKKWASNSFWARRTVDLKLLCLPCITVASWLPECILINKKSIYCSNYLPNGFGNLKLFLAHLYRCVGIENGVYLFSILSVEDFRAKIWFWCYILLFTTRGLAWKSYFCSKILHRQNWELVDPIFNTYASRQVRSSNFRFSNPLGKKLEQHIDIYYYSGQSWHNCPE